MQHIDLSDFFMHVRSYAPCACTNVSESVKFYKIDVLDLLDVSYPPKVDKVRSTFGNEKVCYRFD